MWLTLWHSGICKIVILIKNIWKPSRSIYYCQNCLIWRNFHENFCWPELSFSFHVLAKIFAWLTLRKKGLVKGDQSEPPIQNLAKMTLNKFDYSNHVQWNIQEACHQNEHTLLSVVTTVTHVTCDSCYKVFARWIMAIH